MKTITYDQLETLKLELRDIRDEFASDRSLRKDLLEKFRAKEKEVKQATRIYSLNAFNREQQAKRDAAKVVFDLEAIDFNDITNDGLIHKNKLKKYPKFSELEYYRVVRDFSRNSYEVRHKGEWRLFKYENGEHVRVVDFEDFLSVNNIQPKEITLKQYEAIEKKLIKIREKVDNALKELSEVSKEYYQFRDAILSQRHNNYYTLETKF